MTDHTSDRITRIAARARAEAKWRPESSGRTVPPIPDPAAVADAILSRKRMSRILERAATHSCEHDREASRRPGESTAEALERVIAEGMPPAVMIVAAPPLSQTRLEYESLKPHERRCELERHMWSCEGKGRMRTHFSDLLDAMGVGR